MEKSQIRMQAAGTVGYDVVPADIYWVLMSSVKYHMKFLLRIDRLVS